jgi:hypothetical protein
LARVTFDENRSRSGRNRNRNRERGDGDDGRIDTAACVCDDDRNGERATVSHRCSLVTFGHDIRIDGRSEKFGARFALGRRTSREQLGERGGVGERKARSVGERETCRWTFRSAGMNGIAKCEMQPN